MPTSPRWADRLYLGLVGYAVTCAVLMLSGIGGETVTHYVGLFGDAPADLTATIVAFATARRLPPGPQRRAWRWFAIALTLYLAGTCVTVVSWLRGIDPFPGPSDVFFSAFYPAMLVAALYHIRAADIRVAWSQLFLDAVIFVVGFGSFFWFLVNRPATAHTTQLEVLKELLSEAYAGLDCVVLLLFGVLLLTGLERRRIPLLLMAGFATMFLADMLWSLAKMGGYYASGELQDVFYLACYIPWAAAGREQMRTPSKQPITFSATLDTVTRSLPYAALLTALLVLIYMSRSHIGGPAGVMTTVVFALTLLLMIRQGMILRNDAAARERRAARLVEDRFASLIANASDVIMIVEANGDIRFASPAAERTLGFRPDEVTGKNLLDAWMGPDTCRLRTLLEEICATTSGTIGPVELAVERGNHRFVLECVGSNLTADPAVGGLALNLRDISERKALEEQLRTLAFHDSLTLLANRALFKDRVEHALNLAQRTQALVAVLFLDLDNFKTINDSLGHDAGDRLLQAVAHRIVQSTRPADTVARLGGDEFAILIERVRAADDVRGVAESLIGALAPPFPLSGIEVQVTASIGAALSSDTTGAESLLGNADIAMYHAKSTGKNGYAAFEPRMQDVLHERLRLEADIGRALSEDEFFLEFQPIIDLGTRSLLGVEALVRWRHPQAGVLMPAQFIPAAEESGQIIKLGRWVLSRACHALMAWRGCVSGGNGLRVSVNVSGRHLQHGDLVHDVADALQTSGLEASNLVIELTESTIMYNTDANLERLERLKALGVRLALDDFGTGYSSLSYLHRFPIDILKIDRSFVGRLTNSDNGPELARAVITLGETLGLDTVAEGIEHEAQVTALLALRCVAGQGFLFANAGPLEHLSNSAFTARRNELWTAEAADEILSASGRFKALKSALG